MDDETPVDGTCSACCHYDGALGLCFQYDEWVGPGYGECDGFEPEGGPGGAL